MVAQEATKIDRPPADSCSGRGVLYENGLYRSWELETQYAPGRNFGSYARDTPVSVAIRYNESADGFTWSEPVRSAIEVPGQTGFDGKHLSYSPAHREQVRDDSDLFWFTDVPGWRPSRHGSSRCHRGRGSGRRRRSSPRSRA